MKYFLPLLLFMTFNLSATAQCKLIALDTVDEFGKPAVMAVPNDKDSLMLPMHDAIGKVWGLQIIRGTPGKGQMQKEQWPKIPSWLLWLRLPLQGLLIFWAYLYT